MTVRYPFVESESTFRQTLTKLSSEMNSFLFAVNKILTVINIEVS